MSKKLDDEFDIPYGDLPLPGRSQFARNPIVVVNAEVRFARENPVLSESDVKKIWKKLGGSEEFRIEKQEHNNINVTLSKDGANQSQQVVTNWVLFSKDTSLSIILNPSFLNVEVNKYDHFGTSLAKPLSAAISAFTSVTKASLIQRIGLRYVNRLVDSNATTSEFWKPNVKAGFAGPIDGPLGHALTGSHQEVQIALTDVVSAIIHSLVFKDTAAADAYSFIVDADVFITQTLDYSQVSVDNVIRKLNRTAFAVLYQILTAEYIQKMGVTQQGEE